MAILPIYEIVSVDEDGGNRQTHAQADQLEPAHDELNQVGSFSFSLPLGDASVAYLPPAAGREIQIWRNGILKWWGPVTNRRYSNRKWEITCKSVMWYLTKRIMGRAGRTNYLVNGDFGAGSLTGWTTSGVTAGVVTQWGTHAGSYQANLYQGGAGQDTFITQTVKLQPGYYTLAGWFQIRTDATYVGPAVDGRGLYVERLGADNTTVDTVQFFAITDDTPRGVFQRATTNIQIDRPDTFVRVRLYSTRCTSPTPTGGRPPGSIIWAKTQLVLQESQSFPYPSDLADVFNNLVIHAQDTAYGKNSVFIQAVNSPSGLLVDRTYQHADHQVIFDALSEWSDAGLCDFGITWNQTAQTRALTLYPGKKGTTFTDRSLDIDANLIEVSTIEEDGEKVITSAIVTGQGTGADTDEGGFRDTSLTAGLVLESVAQQRSNGYYDQLALQAAELVAISKGAFQVPSVTASASAIDVVSLGDVLPMLFAEGNMQENVRVTATDLDLELDHYVLTVQPSS